MNPPSELGTRGKSLIALSLTAVGGFVDAVGYIALFQVFTANMSGNSIHVGMYLGKLELMQLARPACAIMSYVVGLVLTRILLEVAGRSGVRRIASLTLAIEAFLLLLFARATPVMHLGQIVDQHAPVYFALVALLAFAMGMQTATLTHIGALTVYTTFVTGTLTRFSEAFTRTLFWFYDEAKTSRLADIVRRAPQQDDVYDTAFFAAVWICYVLGAAAGALSKQRWELRAMLFPAGVLLLFVAVDLVRPIAAQEQRQQHTG